MFSTAAQLRRWGDQVITGQITDFAALVKAQIRAHYANVCEDFVCRCNFVTHCYRMNVLSSRLRLFP